MKTQQMQDAIEEMFPGTQALREKNMCPLCESLIDETKFVDKLSLKEFHISGMCQACQDWAFGASYGYND